MASSPFQILTLNPISGRGLAKFPASRYTVGSAVYRPDAILMRSHPLAVSEVADSVLAIARAGAGTDNIPVSQMTERGIPVFNTPGANANAVKELVVAAMLIGARNLIPAIRYAQSLPADARALEQALEAAKKQFAGIELPGRTLGVIGLGAVGTKVADAAVKLGMKVVCFDPKITVEATWGLPAMVRRAHSIEELIKISDFVTLHLPLFDSTYHLIDSERVAMMKNGSILLNFSRGEIVDEDAVAAGIDSKKISWYLSDFPSPRLSGNPNAVMLPHLGASTEEAEDNCAVMVVNELMDYLEHGNLANTVNFPDVAMPRESEHRIAVVNANIPNMLGRISSTLAAGGINIHNMINKSRGQTAYTLVDMDQPAPFQLIEEIAAIPGVVRVRDLPLAAS